MSFEEEDGPHPERSPSAPLLEKGQNKNSQPKERKGFVFFFFGMRWKKWVDENDFVFVSSATTNDRPHNIDYQFKFTDRRGRDYRKSMPVDI